MQTKKFEVSKFENLNGTTAWRVSGWLNNARIRRNFPTRDEAIAEAASLEIREAQIAAGMRFSATFLTEEQLRDAEASYRRLKGKSRPLHFYVDFALANYREPDLQKPLKDAVSLYLAVKTKETERGFLSPRQLRSIRNELTIFAAHFRQATTCEFTAPTIKAYLERGGEATQKTYNNRRGLLSTFFKYAFQQDWIVSNPVERTPHYRIHHKRGSAVTLTAERSAELMAYLETLNGGELVPNFALCLFAGIRPCVRFGEIKKLKVESVRLDTGVIHIEPEVSKVRMKRLVTIQPNLAEWLSAYPLDEFQIVPPDAMNARARVCKQFGLTHDVLRHTFISMFVAKFRSMGEAALQAGNSETIIRRHYLDIKAPAEAERFFSIRPKLRIPAINADVIPINATTAIVASACDTRVASTK